MPWDIFIPQSLQGGALEANDEEQSNPAKSYDDHESNDNHRYCSVCTPDDAKDEYTDRNFDQTDGNISLQLADNGPQHHFFERVFNVIYVPSKS